MTDDVPHLSVTDLVAALEAKEISAVEALEALANRVEARNPEIKCGRHH